MAVSEDGHVEVLLTQPIDRITEFLPALEKRFTVHRLWEVPDKEAFLRSQTVSRTRAVVCNTVEGASAQLLDALPCLEMVATVSVGLDKIDLSRCRLRGIAVCNTPDVLTDCTADTAIALLLALLRRVCSAHRFLCQGLWSSRHNFMLTTKVSGKHVGIVGLGRIGLAIAKRAEGFGCAVSYQGRSSKPNLPYVYYHRAVDLARSSDVLIISCALTEETRHSIGRDVLDALGSKGFLINVARGPIVDEAELVKALSEGRLGGAGLDVYENEPHVPTELCSMDNVVLTPHIGSSTLETERAMTDLVLCNLDAYFSGKPLITPVL